MPHHVVQTHQIFRDQLCLHYQISEILLYWIHLVEQSAQEDFFFNENPQHDSAAVGTT